MREILFRGKRIDNGEWLLGGVSNDLKHIISDSEWLILLDTLVNPETVGQYTELDDTNGHKVFEGDIVKNRLTGKVGAVVYYKGSWCIWNSTYGKEVDDFLWNWCGSCYNKKIGEYITCEIIGNIHDNPELLEVEE